MNTADLITAFFNNEMSPDQERQFLVSVASSDSLRLGLKSHAMLDRILYEQSSQSRVPVEVRMKIMREAAVVAATAGSALAADSALANDAEASPAPESTAVGNRSLSVSRRFFRWSSATAVLMLALGSFVAGFYTGTETSDDPVANTSGVENREMVSPAEPPAVGPRTSASSPVSSMIEEQSAEGRIQATESVARSGSDRTTAARSGRMNTGTGSSSSGLNTAEEMSEQSSPPANNSGSAGPNGLSFKADELQIITKTDSANKHK